MGKEVSIEEIRKWLIADEKLEQLNNEETEFRKRNPNYSKNILENKEFDRKAFLENYLKDIYVNGLVYNQVIEYGKKPYYFRGQNQDYGNCNSTLSRKLKEESNDLELFKAYLKQAQLYIELQKLKSVLDWKKINAKIFSITLAQHFGMATDIVDITNSLSVALFFATCIHIENNRFRPISEEDIKKNKYGVLYILESEWIKVLKTNNTLLNLKIEVDYIKNLSLSISNNQISPIGYLPFSRCHKQKGYFIVDDLSGDFKLENKGFKKIIFKHNIEFSKEIFDKFNGGEDIFDYEYSEEFQKLINKIDDSKFYSRISFKAAYNLYKKRSKEKMNKKMILEHLYEEGIKIKKCNFLVEENIKRINKMWDLRKFLNKENICPGSRKIVGL